MIFLCCVVLNKLRCRRCAELLLQCCTFVAVLHFCCRVARVDFEEGAHGVLQCVAVCCSVAHAYHVSILRKGFILIIKFSRLSTPTFDKNTTWTQSHLCLSQVTCTDEFFFPIKLHTERDWKTHRRTTLPKPTFAHTHILRRTTLPKPDKPYTFLVCAQRWALAT